MGGEALENILREHMDLANYEAVARSITEIDPDLTKRLVELAIPVLLE